MIKFINKETDIAIRVICYITKRNKKYTISELSKSLKLSYSFLRKILQVLARYKILNSIKGKNGGFQLIKSADSINIMDVVRIFQQGIEFLNCIDSNGESCILIKDCKLRKKLLKMEKSLKIKFSKTTLAEFI